MTSFSVALCTRNGETHLAPLLRSLAAQTRRPDELVVFDDRSTDGSVRMIEHFARSAPFSVVVNVNDRSLGPARNFERAFAACGGDWIAPCDQDDVWHSDKLAEMAGAIDGASAVGMVFSDLAIMGAERPPLTQWAALGFDDAAQREVRAGRAFDVLLRFNVVTGAAMAFRASLRSLVLPIGEGWIHDEWIALLAAAVAPVLILRRPLVDYRVHAHQAIGPAVTGLRAQLAYARERMGSEYFEQQVRRAEVALERLATSPIRPMSINAVPALEAKLAHLRARCVLRGHFLRRPLLAAIELARGNYRRFGYGWRSFAQDLVL